MLWLGRVCRFELCSVPATVMHVRVTLRSSHLQVNTCIGVHGAPGVNTQIAASGMPFLLTRCSPSCLLTPLKNFSAGAMFEERLVEGFVVGVSARVRVAVIRKLGVCFHVRPLIPHGSAGSVLGVARRPADGVVAGKFALIERVLNCPTPQGDGLIHATIYNTRTLRRLANFRRSSARQCAFEDFMARVLRSLHPPTCIKQSLPSEISCLPVKTIKVYGGARIVVELGMEEIFSDTVHIT